MTDDLTQRQDAVSRRSDSRRAKDYERSRRAKDYEHSIIVLEEMLAADPEAIDPAISRAHLCGLRGMIDLGEYRNVVAELIPRMNGESVPDLAVWRKVLRGIQYSVDGPQRDSQIRDLLAQTRDTVRTRRGNWRDAALFEADLYLALRHYEDFAERVDTLSEIDHEKRQLRPLRRIARKIRRPSFPNRRSEKIFGIGLSRTGTSSLNRALNMLGYHAIHWLNPHTQTVITGEDYPLFDAFSDISISYRFEEIYREYPNAKFIYTTRPKAAWLESIAAHYRNSSGVEHPCELDSDRLKRRFHGTVYPVEHNLYARHANWGDAFDHFETRIRQHFDGYSHPRLLTLRITEGDGWDVLCRFLDKDRPDRPFPNMNKRPAKIAQEG